VCVLDGLNASVPDCALTDRSGRGWSGWCSALRDANLDIEAIFIGSMHQEGMRTIISCSTEILRNIRIIFP